MLGSAEIVVIGISAFGVIGCVVATLLAFRSYGKQAGTNLGTEGSTVQEPLFDPKAYISSGLQEPTNYPHPPVLWRGRIPANTGSSDVLIFHEDLAQAYDSLNDAANRLAHIEPIVQGFQAKGAELSDAKVTERMLLEAVARSTLDKGQWQKTFTMLLQFLESDRERSSDLESPETKRRPSKPQG